MEARWDQEKQDGQERKGRFCDRKYFSCDEKSGPTAFPGKRRRGADGLRTASMNLLAAACRVDFSGEGVSTENTVRLSVACESGGGKDCALQARRMGRWREGLGDDRQLLAARGEEGAESRDAGLGPGRGTRLPYGPLSASASWALMRRLSSRGTVTLSFPRGSALWRWGMYHSSPKPGFPDSSAGKESTCNAGDPGWIPGSGGSAGDGIDRLPTPIFLGFPCGSAGIESACDAGVLDLIPGLGRFSREGKGYPLQYCGLENSTDCIVHGIAKSRTRLSDFHFPQSQLPILLTDAPKDLVISISYTDEPALEPRGESPHLEVQKGQSLRLLCTADSLPLATLSWTLQDRVLSWSHPLGSTALELALPGVKAEDAGRYTCRAENRLGFLSRSLDLSVQYAPENLKVMVSQANRTALENLESGASLRVLEGQSLRLLCVAHSNPPAQLSWARLGRTVSPSQPSDPGVLELPQIQTEQEGEFICRAQNPLGSQNISLSLSVVSPPQLLGPSCSQEDEGLRCSCSSRARPAPSLRWRLGEGLLEGELSNASFEVASSSAGPWANSSLSLREGLSSGLRLSCEALNGHGVRSGSVLLLPDEKGLASGAFASGISLGIGVTTLLFLCFILILVRTLRKKWTQAKVPAPGEAPRSRFSRRSTILDYINVIPKAGPLKQKAKPSSPSQPPPADGHSLEARKNQKELHVVSHNCPGPKSSLQASEAENNQEELHYAVLNFPGLRPWETQRPEGTHPEYAEIQFH